MDAGKLGHSVYVLWCGVDVTVVQIVEDRAVEEDCILKHKEGKSDVCINRLLSLNLYCINLSKILFPRGYVTKNRPRIQYREMFISPLIENKQE